MWGGGDSGVDMIIYNTFKLYMDVYILQRA